MYNKIFTKILDSSIWLETNSTRIVWLTFLAAMDEQGFAQFASVANLAHRARVDLPDCEAAVKCLESADVNSSDPENEGRRIERVSGGWIVLNAEKYRDLVTRAVAQEKTRERVARFRERKRHEAASNAGVTQESRSVTPSEAVSRAESLPIPPDLQLEVVPAGPSAGVQDAAADIYAEYPRKVGRSDALKAIRAAMKTKGAEFLLEKTKAFSAATDSWPESEKQFIPHPATWFNRGSYDDDPETWKRLAPKGKTTGWSAR